MGISTIMDDYINYEDKIRKLKRTVSRLKSENQKLKEKIKLLSVRTK